MRHEVDAGMTARGPLPPMEPPTAEERQRIIENVLDDLARTYPLADRFEIAALAVEAVNRFLPPAAAA